LFAVTAAQLIVCTTQPDAIGQFFAASRLNVMELQAARQIARATFHPITSHRFASNRAVTAARS
jgi:hypothetical protein